MSISRMYYHFPSSLLSFEEAILLLFCFKFEVCFVYPTTAFIYLIAVIISFNVRSLLHLSPLSSFFVITTYSEPTTTYLQYQTSQRYQIQHMDFYILDLAYEPFDHQHSHLTPTIPHAILFPHFFSFHFLAANFVVWYFGYFMYYFVWVYYHLLPDYFCLSLNRIQICLYFHATSNFI